MPERPAGGTKTKDSADEPTQPKPGTAESTESKTGDAAKGAKGATAKVEPQQIQKVKTYFSSAQLGLSAGVNPGRAQPANQH